MGEIRFTKDFLLGTATASYQVEGAALEGGRGESIWDRFCTVPGRVYGGENGTVACDQYHRYEEDIQLMKQAGIKAYRFSIAWPRIIPDGTGPVNPEGIAYYRNLITSLNDAGIEPVVTLYHWDLPQVLQDAGGWTSRETAYAFEAYAKVCFSEFAGMVKRWITLNEPWCSAYLGYLEGVHAPGIRDVQSSFEAIHHLNLAHGLAVKAFRNMKTPGEIGIAWNLYLHRPARDCEEDRAAAEYQVEYNCRMFTGPVLGTGYPEQVIEREGVKLPLAEGDLDTISGKIDFIGLNYYSERAVISDASSLQGWAFAPTWEAVTDMGWEIVPEGLLRVLRWMHRESGGIPLYVTENGAAFQDTPEIDLEGNKRIRDMERIRYLRDHFDACRKALEEGIDLRGYFLWSLIDNFEWSFGYTKRFGIIWCDFQTLERTPKDSFWFYRDVIARSSKRDEL